MNIMRKLRGSSGGGSFASSSAQDEASSNPQHTALGLMHLKKLFSEYSHPQHPLSEQERHNKLYNMLPLFCKVFGDCPTSDMVDKFRDILAFCHQVSALMVAEIRRRASNQSTEMASCSIVSFLEIGSSEESSNGWMLLSALNLLAAGDLKLVQVMTSLSVPSTLVKCLYLFFDLPEMKDGDLAEPGNEFTPRERRILLQKIFVQMLVRLCSHACPAEELARKDDLSLLFSAITSSCPSQNVMWRKSAAEVLMTISRHGLTKPVVNYIHNKGCVALCLENMQRAKELSPLEIVEMFVAVFCFLKDSSEVSQTLLDDFRTCQGYAFLSDFLLKLEQEKGSESQEATRNLVLMLASLSTCGFKELKPSPASQGSLFQMGGFILPQPSGQGASVRNIAAFQVLQTAFLKSNCTGLCSSILDAISGVYHADNANYFILEDQNTLSQFAEKIHLKPKEIQDKFFQLLEFIVFQLNFVPCKELISLSILLKGQASLPCSITCMRTLLNILRHNAVFKDVYREVGILEVFVTCLTRYAKLLKDKELEIEQNKDYTLPEEEVELGMLVIEALTTLLAGNVSNANVFRECGGAQCAHNLVPYIDCRKQALGIVRELMMGAGGEDDMGTLLGMMHSAPSSLLELKTHILKSLLLCLRDSHRTRTAFRKVGGFVYVTSVLVSLEGRLGEDFCNPEDMEQVLTVLHTVFNTLTVAMRFEPANAKFFYQEICTSSLCDSLRLLGCFTSQKSLQDCDETLFAKEENTFYNLFISNVLEPSFPEQIPMSLSYACIVLRLLYDVALDVYDKPNATAIISFKSPSHRNRNSIEPQRSLESPSGTRRVNSLNLTPPPPDPVVVHPGVVLAIWRLLPSIHHNEHSQVALTLQLFAAEILKSLVRSERNQQVMCEAGLPGQLLEFGSVALEDETHPLHQPLQYMLERLAAQGLEPKDLRDFLRLGDPLCCLPLDFYHHGRAGGAVPLTRVKTIVSMTTPRDFRAHQTSLPPAFVEFDMSAEGFGGLYLPSIAPQGPSGGSAIVGATLNAAMDNNITGGIGSGDRVFPPQTGLTYSTWLCVDKFSDPRTDPHPVRLLTLVRNLPESHLICLTVLLSARDKAIIVSTHETHMPHNNGDWEPEGLGDCSARVWCPDLLQEGQWHHLALVLNRAVLKNSACSVYVDGQHIHTQKLHYISQNPGGGAANLTVASSVYGYIGTPPSWRRYSRLTWKQGPCHLLEEVLSPQTVALVHQLGPQYMGSLQAPPIQSGQEPCPALVTEDKVIFGLNAKAVSQLTLAKIRKVYNRADNRSVARQLGMSSHENATPIRILHNSAGHLGGSARSLGGVVIGYLGVRVFSPRPVAKVVDSVGGCAVLLGLIAMAQDVESLYAGVKALVCVVRSNRCAQLEMDRRRGYQTLAMLLRRKTPLLNSHILHLTFSLVGSVDSGRESSCVPNPQAFQDLLCDIEVWHQAPGELVKSLFEHLLELVSESSEKKTNLRLLRELMLVPRLLHVLPSVMAGPPPTRAMLLTLLGVLLAGNPRPVDLLHFGQLVTATLSSPAIDEKNLVLQEVTPLSWDQAPVTGTENILRDPVSCVFLRNRCLQMLHSLLFTARGTINQPFCNEVVRVLGLDWALLWTQPNLHAGTVVWGLRILVALCSNPILLQKFRDGSGSGGWLQDTQHLQDKMGGLLGYQLGTSPGTQKSQEIRLDAVHVPGFQRLSWQLPYHLEVPEVYFLIMALMMGQPVKLLPADSKLDLDNVWNFLFGMPAGQSVNTLAGKVSLCPEAVTTLLTMVRAMLNQEGKSPESLPQWLCDYPVTIIQFLFFLYQNMLDFKPVFMSGDVLTALAGTLFPRGPGSEISSCASSPVDEVFPTEDSTTVTHSPTKENLLTSHPARKFVMDFLRVIVVDSLSLPVSGKGPPVIDLVLNASPESASSAQHTRYQTEVLSLLMEHLLAADVLVGDQAALPIVFGGASNNVAPNVCYLAARVVDKLWQGNLSKDPHDVFDFVVKLISQAKRRPGGTSLEGLYHCLNRTILFLLSRATETLTQQMSVLEALHKLTTHRLLVFGAGNHELDFIGCLIYCLLQLTSDMKIMLDTNIKTTWHVNPQVDDSDDKLNTRQGHNLMVVAATRVWEELYVCKKPAIEEVFKITLNSPNNKAPELSLVRDQVLESAHKVWLNYVDMERKATCKVPWELHNQIQSKIQKVTGGLTRLASRTKSKKEEPAKTKCMLSGTEIQSCAEQHIGLVKALVDLRRRDISQHMIHMQRIVYEEWLETETELTRERGLWGPSVGSRLDKWMLDMTEGPSRMRKKMMRNDMFYVQYPYRPELDSGDNKSLKYKVATSWDSKDFYHKYRPRGLIDHERDNMIEAHNNKDREREVEETDDSNSNMDDASAIKGFQSIVRHSVNRSVSEPDDAADDGPESADADEREDVRDSGEDQDSTSDNQTLIRLLEPQEKISYMFRCARIQGLDTMEGLLLFGKEHVYIVDGLTVLRSREVRDIDSLPPHLQEPILPSPGPGSPTRAHSMRHSYKFHYEDIREVHKRRYLLQPMALEVFSSDGRNQLLAFQRKIRNKVYHRFHANATGIADSAQQSVAGQKRTANVEQAAGLLSNLIGETSVTQRWVRGEISNFQYLMHLNTLAGRSYNDLMQYPIFPWILADYDSPEVDFNDPATFRDFTKPMGAQSPDRLHQFKKRFKEWDDPHGETPPYHYGTHYSSAMIVCSYLVRMEPFTQHFLRLQGGHFDLADRMFNSVREAWLSASRHNMADVKELIPEFFYLPEFLTNSNNFDLGCKQNGVQLGDVVLPPWAKDDPQEFIRVHRAALECDAVSSKLHHWIDLIFGYKQQGQAAVEATNVFHHLFYEGNVDIYNIDDPLKKNATIGFINNFGQIPKQLFKRLHPAKKLNGGPTTPGLSLSLREAPLPCSQKLFFDQLDSLVPSLQAIKELKGPVGQILCVDKMLLAVEQNKVLVPPSYNKYLAWGFADHSLRIGHYDSDRTILVCEATGESSGEVVACVCPSAKLVVTAGTCSVVAVWEYNRRQLRVKQCLYGHTAAVTCLAASPAYNVVVSGSRDCSAIVWDLSRLIFVRQLKGHSAPIAAVAVNDITGDIATCAGTWLHIWTINGIELASVDTAVGRPDRMQQILCVAFSQMHEWDSKNVIMTGSTDGVVRMWSMDYVQVPKDDKLVSIDSDISQEKNENESQEVPVGKGDSPCNEPVTEIVKRLSSAGILAKSGSESSLSDSEDKQNKRLAKKEAENKDEEKEHCSDGAEDVEASALAPTPPTSTTPLVRVSSISEILNTSGTEIPPVRVRRRSSAARANAQYRKSEGSWLHSDAPLPLEKSIDCLDPESALGAAAQRMRASKSDTSLTDSFVMVSGDGGTDEEDKSLDGNALRRPMNVLRDGFKWQRQLVFRSKLTMHTAYDRKDNTEPASITALAVSKDHRTVYVGDARGRVFTWSMAEQPGRGMADHWLRDEGAENCVGCNVRFNLYERRHHCRNCGQVFCSKCSRFESEISRLRILKPVRVCQGCYATLRGSNRNSTGNS